MIFEELVDFQMLETTDIPENVWHAATVVEDEDRRYYRMDVLWHYISAMKQPDHAVRFPRLNKIAKLVLTILHSNAQEERVFSMVRKNKTAFMSSLDPKGTLTSILTIKLACTEPAHLFNPPDTLLKQAKEATWKYNKEHCSKK